MDTSKTYIEMCRKATKDLVDYDSEWQDGDFGVIGKEVVRFVDGFTIRPEFSLYRQDQLQEMVPGYIERSHFAAWLADKFADFAVSEANKLNTEMTMEQLWLAFVMREKYHKVWNGTEWVKE